jgi:hypothetical protein
MTGRHAAPRDEAFDQLERDRAGAHRADVEVPLGPDDVAAPAARAKAAPVKKAASATAKTTTSAKATASPKTAPSTSKKAGTS